ncbi:MAG: GNAT family N-acetyltransferase [Candidatus Pelethousia sp.]|nr:GNAT family N-acetyltransferase [Candidatus Pelethousia sp.]
MIDTERCHLRRFEEKDLDAFMEYRNNALWMQYQGFKGLGKEAYCSVLLAAFNLDKGVQIAIIHKAEQRLIGDLYMKQDGNELWIGYTIHPMMAGQGYAYEAVNGMLAWIRKQGFRRVRALTLPQNLASIKLLKKLKFGFEGTNDVGEELYALDLSRATDGGAQPEAGASL